MIHPRGSSKGCLDGVHVRLPVWACGFCVLLSDRGPCVLTVVKNDLMDDLCHRWRHLSLGICEISLKGGNNPLHRQLSPFRPIILVVLVNQSDILFNHHLQNNRPQHFWFFVFGQETVPWDSKKTYNHIKNNSVPSFQSICLSVEDLCFSSGKNVCFTTPTSPITAVCSRALEPDQ